MKAPAFQYYPRDLLCDANVMAMSLEELGAYWKLVSICWLEMGLPGTETGLARLLQVPVARFRKLWPALEPCFVLDGKGRYQHPRLDKERAKQEDYRARQAEKGRLSAASRKATGDQPEVNHKATGVQPEVNSASASASAICKEERVRADALAGLWNDVTQPPIPRCHALTAKRRKAATARLSERPMSEWAIVFDRINASSFCRGESERGWVASFDWAMRPDTAVMVLEGKYDDRKPMAKPIPRAVMGLVPDPDQDDYHAMREQSLARQRAEKAQAS